MQRQKTVAKWLIVILLTTLAIGSYVVFDTLYRPGDVTASGDNNDTPGEETPPEHIPYYTTLPRTADTIDGTAVTHIGGEGSDTVKAAISVGGSTLMFISSDSEEYDMRGAGLYAAYISQGILMSCERLSQDAEKILAVKAGVFGAVLLTAAADSNRLYSFGFDGSLTAVTDTVRSDAAGFYYLNRDLWYISAAGGRLRAAVIERDLTLKYDNFAYSSDADTIHEIFPAKDGLAIVTGSGDDYTEIVLYNQYKGFSKIKSLDKLSFMQIESVSFSDGGSGYVILGRQSDGLCATVLDTSFTILHSVSFEDADSGVIFRGASDIYLITDKDIIRLCNHLDVISEAEHMQDISPLLGRTMGGYSILLARRVNGIAVMEFDPENGISELLSVGGVSDVAYIYLDDSKLSFALTAHSSAGLTYANFGKSDAFYIELMRADIG